MYLLRFSRLKVIKLVAYAASVGRWGTCYLWEADPPLLSVGLMYIFIFRLPVCEPIINTFLLNHLIPSRKFCMYSLSEVCVILSDLVITDGLLKSGLWIIS